MATTAKKTTATTKKTTTAKPAAKKTTTAKPAAKKTTTAKPAAKSTDISVTGNKKLDTLRKEFNKKFPCLQLGIFYSYARQQVAKGESITQIDGTKTLASVRRADSGGDISISGNKKIKTLEKEFDTALAGVKDLTFDMSNLEYVSSAGLRVILKAQKIMNTQGAMKLTGVNDSIMEVFDITGFLDILTIE